MEIREDCYPTLTLFNTVRSFNTLRLPGALCTYMFAFLWICRYSKGLLIYGPCFDKLLESLQSICNQQVPQSCVSCTSYRLVAIDPL